MANVVLHIGLHKTATGVLQRQFFPACAEVNLFTTADPKVKEFVLNTTRTDPIYFDPEATRALLKGGMDENRINVLSNESLSCLPFAGVIESALDHRSPIIKNLAAVFPDAKVVLVIRRQDKFARSLYRQYLKSGGTRSISRFYGYGSNREPIVGQNRFMYAKYIDFLNETFSGRLLVLPYEAFVKDNEQFLRKLADFCGINELPALTLKKENASTLSPRMLVVSSLINHFFRSLLNPGGLIPGYDGVRYGVKGKISLGRLLHEKWPFKYKGDFTEGRFGEVCESILQAAKEDNRVLDERYNLDLKRFGYY